MELVYTDKDFNKQGVIRDFTLDMAYGDNENDFLLTMPLPSSRRYGADREAVISDLPGVGSITIDNANGSQLAGLGVDGLAERKASKNLLDTSNAQAGKVIVSATGDIAGASVASASDYIGIVGGETYTMRHGGLASSAYGAAFYDNAKAYISGVNFNVAASAGGVNTFVSPANALYIRVCWLNSVNPQLELGSNATEYEPYYPPRVDVVQGKNLANMAHIGQVWSIASGNLVSLSGGFSSEQISTSSGEAITSSVSGASAAYLVFFNADKSLNSFVNANKNGNTTATTPNGASYVALRVDSGIAGETDVSKYKPQLERGTAATPYVPYGALEVVTRGKNLFDVGKYPFTDAKWINSNGNFTTSSTGKWAATETYIPFSQYVGETVCFSHIGNDSDACFYDDAKQVILYKNFRTSTGFSTVVPDGTAYVRFDCLVDNKSNVQIEIGEVETEYEPYTETRTTLDLQGNVLASLPDGTKDELTVDASGHAQLVKRVGVVDLGSLAYTQSASIPNSFFFTQPGVKIFDVNVVSNAVCPIYKTVKYKDLANNDLAISARGNNGEGYQIRDTRYSSAAEFKNAMSGVLLYYELAEPQTIDLGTIELPYTLDGYTRFTIEATINAPFMVRYVETPESKSYLVEIVPELEIGALVYEHGTDIGGIIDTKGFDNTGDVPVMTYSGRTWHGMMGASITRPDAGQDYLMLTGDINAAIATLISRSGMDAVFGSAGAAGVSVSYQVPRYVSMWEALRRLCKQYGMRPQISRENGKTMLGAAVKADYSNGAVSDLTMGLQFERMSRPVNHLVLLGQGELASRTVIDIYADSEGNVSTTQTLFGSDEVAEVYENTGESDAGKLLNDGIEKLLDMQKFASVGMSLPSNEDFQIGDTVTAYSVETGLVAAAEVVKKVVMVGEYGFATTDYELGEPAIKAYN